MKFKNNLGNEFYTRRETIENCPFLDRIKGRKIFCPFDSEESEFVKGAKENNVKMKNFSKDYLSKESEKLREKDAVIFTNPPFYIFTDIAKYYKEKGNDCLILGRDKYKEILYRNGIKFETSKPYTELFIIPDPAIFEDKTYLTGNMARISNICGFGIEGDRKNEKETRTGGVRKTAKKNRDKGE